MDCKREHLRLSRKSTTLLSSHPPSSTSIRSFALSIFFDQRLCHVPKFQPSTRLQTNPPPLLILPLNSIVLNFYHNDVTHLNSHLNSHFQHWIFFEVPYKFNSWKLLSRIICKGSHSLSSGEWEISFGSTETLVE